MTSSQERSPGICFHMDIYSHAKFCCHRMHPCGHMKNSFPGSCSTSVHSPFNFKRPEVTWPFQCGPHRCPSGHIVCFSFGKGLFPQWAETYFPAIVTWLMTSSNLHWYEKYFCYWCKYNVIFHPSRLQIYKVICNLKFFWCKGFWEGLYYDYNIVFKLLFVCHVFIMCNHSEIPVKN